MLVDQGGIVRSTASSSSRHLEQSPQRIPKECYWFRIWCMNLWRDCGNRRGGEESSCRCEKTSGRGGTAANQSAAKECRAQPRSQKGGNERRREGQQVMRERSESSSSSVRSMGRGEVGERSGPRLEVLHDEVGFQVPQVRRYDSTGWIARAESSSGTPSPGNWATRESRLCCE